MRYITARSVMNRLDYVLGPENWWDEYEPHEDSVLCRLTIRLPDGSTITKADAGGYAGMQDAGDDDKSGYSDAFKRAAVKFGVGRHLYGDGVVTYPQPAAAVPAAPARAAGAHSGQRQPPPEPAKAPTPWEQIQGWIQQAVDQVNTDWVTEGEGRDMLISDLWHAVNGMFSDRIRRELMAEEDIQADGKRSKPHMRSELKKLWDAKPQGLELKQALGHYLQDKLEKAREQAKGGPADDA